MPRDRRAWLPALFLFFFAPVSAEYLIGYDDIIDDPAVLIFALLILGPLYGAPAVLIREATRRYGRGWPTILALGLAFGLVEAGLIDQSLFNPDYRDIPYWSDLREPTLVPGGVSVAMAFGFLVGHMIGSIAAPIALTEALFPDRARRPWLGPSGLAWMAVLWLAAAGFVLGDTLSTESFRPSLAQLAGTSLLVLALIVVAFTLPPPRVRPARSLPVPPPLVVGAVTALLLGARPLLDGLVSRSAAAAGWTATLFGIALLLLWGALLSRWSSRAGWTDGHVLAAAAAAMLSVGAVAFTVEPLGDPSPVPRYAANTVLLVVVAALVAVAYVRQQRQTTT